jgi:DNA segregation ATPase FtsK/SpoIIIE-like protein
LSGRFEYFPAHQRIRGGGAVCHRAHLADRLVTYEPSDPVWFFTTGVSHPPANFIGRVGAFIAELSFQLFGYGAYFLPAALGVVGWHYFWCQTPDAAYTKAFGGALLLVCASAFFSLVLGSTELAAKTFDAGAPWAPASAWHSPSTSIAPARSSCC